MADYALIMAGGSGTRFWPLSRRKKPKQLLKLWSDRTLLEETVERVLPVVPARRILVLCNLEYRDDIREMFPDIPGDQIVGEPVGRNTAPCICLAAEIVARQDPEAVFCVLPADHFIRDTNRFRSLLSTAMKVASAHRVLITFGIVPSTPHTGYGYIHAGKTLSTMDASAVMAADRFVEKPDIQTAEKYLSDGNYYWNSGMFVWKAAKFLEEARAWIPQIYGPIHSFVAEAGGIADEGAFSQMFARLPGMSVDYGVMEKSKDVVLIRGDFGWNDVGSWDALDFLPHADSGNVAVGPSLILHDTRRCIVHGHDTLVACIGVDDLVVVATGDAVLVARKDRAQDVRKIVDKIGEKGLEKYL